MKTDDWQNQHGERPDGGTGIDSAVGRPIGAPYVPRLGAAPKPPVLGGGRSGRPAPGTATAGEPAKLGTPPSGDPRRDTPKKGKPPTNDPRRDTPKPPVTDPRRPPLGGATRDDMRGN